MRRTNEGLAVDVSVPTFDGEATSRTIGRSVLIQRVLTLLSDNTSG